jgi:hypothetical protein
MIVCQNCGNGNSGESNFCRFCGTRFNAVQSQAYEFRPPRPYAWQTDEFQTKNEARPPRPGAVGMPMATGGPIIPGSVLKYSVAHHCSNCGNTYLPRAERRISTAGWVTFAVLLVFFFPLFWIGLLIKEDVLVCQVCGARTRQADQR